MCDVTLTHHEHERDDSCAMSELGKLDSIPGTSITVHIHSR